eukprot:746377-Hanusia_phi.AAC.4
MPIGTGAVVRRDASDGRGGAGDVGAGGASLRTFSVRVSSLRTERACCAPVALAVAPYRTDLARRLLGRLEFPS